MPKGPWGGRDLGRSDFHRPSASAATQQLPCAQSTDEVQQPLRPKLTTSANFTSGTSDVRRAQVGCFLFFVGGILLFLFFLFGLPYLID